MTPSKLVKRKSLGFVRLGLDGGMTEKKSANEGKYLWVATKEGSRGFMARLGFDWEA